MSGTSKTIRDWEKRAHPKALPTKQNSPLICVYDITWIMGVVVYVSAGDSTHT